MFKNIKLHFTALTPESIASLSTETELRTVLMNELYSHVDDIKLTYGYVEAGLEVLSSHGGASDPWTEQKYPDRWLGWVLPSIKAVRLSSSYNGPVDSIYNGMNRNYIFPIRIDGRLYIAYPQPIFNAIVARLGTNFLDPFATICGYTYSKSNSEVTVNTEAYQGSISLSPPSGHTEPATSITLSLQGFDANSLNGDTVNGLTLVGNYSTLDTTTISVIDGSKLHGLVLSRNRIVLNLIDSEGATISTQVLQDWGYKGLELSKSGSNTRYEFATNSKTWKGYADTWFNVIADDDVAQIMAQVYNRYMVSQGLHVTLDAITDDMDGLDSRVTELEQHGSSGSGPTDSLYLRG